VKEDLLSAFLFGALFKPSFTAFAFHFRLHDQLIPTPPETLVTSSLAIKKLHGGRTLSLLPPNAPSAFNVAGAANDGIKVRFIWILYAECF
jgi:hypothetical protein